MKNKLLVSSLMISFFYSCLSWGIVYFENDEDSDVEYDFRYDGGTKLFVLETVARDEDGVRLFPATSYYKFKRFIELSGDDRLCITNKGKLAKEVGRGMSYDGDDIMFPDGKYNTYQNIYWYYARGFFTKENTHDLCALDLERNHGQMRVESIGVVNQDSENTLKEESSKASPKDIEGLIPKEGRMYFAGVVNSDEKFMYFLLVDIATGNIERRRGLMGDDSDSIDINAIWANAESLPPLIAYENTQKESTQASDDDDDDDDEYIDEDEGVHGSPAVRSVVSKRDDSKHSPVSYDSGEEIPEHNETIGSEQRVVHSERAKNENNKIPLALNDDSSQEQPVRKKVRSNEDSESEDHDDSHSNSSSEEGGEDDK